MTHDNINAKLRQDELEQNQKLFKQVADKLVSISEPTFRKDKNHSKALTALAVSPDNLSFFTASKDGSIVKWEIHENQVPKMAIRKKSAHKSKDNKGHKSIVNAMSVNSDFLATGDDSKMIFIWKSSTLEFVKAFHGHRGPITGLTFARGKNVLYSCSKDRSVKTWDLDQMGYVETL